MNSFLKNFPSRTSVPEERRREADIVNDQDEARIRDEAIDWAIRINAPDADDALQQQLLAWIAQSGAHASAWQSAERGWMLMGAVPPVYQDRWPGPVERRAARGRRWRMAAAMGAMAACLLILASPIGLWLRSDYATQAGEMRRIALADGSILHLDAGSAVDVDYAEDRRNVTLKAGRAFFDVRKDRARPFSIHADGADVTVLGTAFDVSLMPEAVDITVERGLVNVAPAAAPGSDFRLAPGQQARVNRESGRRTLAQISQARIAPWRDGQIAVDGATVGEVVAELRRYHAGMIIMRDDELAARPVTGVYDVRDPVAALNAIILPYRGQVTGIGNYILFVSAR